MSLVEDPTGSGLYALGWTGTVSYVSQPAANTWDYDAITHAALALLRMENDDIDEELVASAAHEATQLIDVEIDLAPVDIEADPFDAGAVPALFRAAVKLAAELYLSPPTVDPLGAPDPVAAVRAEVSPWKSRWGIA